MIEVEFRDGKRQVPDHVAEMMESLPTHTMTYEQAMEKANWKLADDHVSRAFDGFVQSHFRNTNGSGR